MRASPRRVKAAAAAVISLAAALLTAAPVLAQEGGLDLRGSVTDGNFLLHGLQDASLSYAGYARAEAAVLNANRENAKIEADLVLTLFYGAYADAYMAPARAFGLASIPALSTALALDVKKLSLTLYLGPVDLTLGRAIINWGYGRVFSPVDAFTSIDLSDIGLPRMGSDVIAATAYLSGVTGLSVIASPTTDMSGFRSGLKVFTNLLGFDLSALAAYRNTGQDLMVGAALKGSVPPLGIGLTMEGVRHITGFSADGWWEAMAGLDYSFFNRTLILTAEYFYNGYPIDPAAVTPAELAAMGRTFIREQYALLSAAVALRDDLAVSASGLLDIQDLTALCSLDVSWSIFDATALSMTVRWFLGDVNGSLPASDSRLEYGISAVVKF